MEFSTDNNIDFHDIEIFLSKFTGGSIYISKKYFDEGIALICINNVKKKNAISGKYILSFIEHIICHYQNMFLNFSPYSRFTYTISSRINSCYFAGQVQ